MSQQKARLLRQDVLTGFQTLSHSVIGWHNPSVHSSLNPNTYNILVKSRYETNTWLHIGGFEHNKVADSFSFSCWSAQYIRIQFFEPKYILWPSVTWGMRLTVFNLAVFHKTCGIANHDIKDDVANMYYITGFLSSVTVLKRVCCKSFQRMCGIPTYLVTSTWLI